MKYIPRSLIALLVLACSESSPAELPGSTADASPAMRTDDAAANSPATASPSMADASMDAARRPGSDSAVGSRPSMTSRPRDASPDSNAGERDAATDGGEPARADAGPQIEFLEPMFFGLPINSIRLGVSGYDPSNDLCISVIWYFNGAGQTRFCGVVDSLRPYVWVEPAVPAGCWGYGPNADLLAVRGCVDFGESPDFADDSVDLEADIDSPEWSGTVRFAGSP